MEHVVHELMRDAYSESGEHERTFLLGGLDAPPLLVDLVHGQLGPQRWLRAPHRESEWLPIYRQMELAHGCSDPHIPKCGAVGNAGGVDGGAAQQALAAGKGAAAAAAGKCDVSTAAAFLRGTEEEAPLESRLAFLRDTKQMNSEQIAATAALVEESAAAVSLE